MRFQLYEFKNNMGLNYLSIIKVYQVKIQVVTKTVENELFNIFNSLQESWACLKIREDAKVIGPGQPGRKPTNVKKDVNLQAVAREYFTLDDEDYLRRVGTILFKEFQVMFILFI